MRNPAPLPLLEDAPDGPALLAAMETAEEKYRRCLATLKLDRSDAARWQCARALIEFDRLWQALRTTEPELAQLSSAP